jgi:L-fuconolactonase
MRILDSHLHLWDDEALTYTWLEGPLAYRFADTELEHARIPGASAEECVFVQAETVPDDFLGEVEWVETMADRLGIVGIVAGVRLDHGVDTTTHLEELAAHPLVIGVRHNLQGEPDGTAVSTAFVMGAREVAQRGWTFDACVRASQLTDVARLAGAIPELQIVLDHLGKPEVGTADAPLAPSAEWVRDLSEFARHPNTYGKLSGLPGEAHGRWSAEQLVPFLDAAADAFGEERLMWGSDWPVSVIGPAEAGDPHAPADGSDTYQPTARTRWADAVASWAADRGHDVDAIMWGNARAFYRLDEPRVVAAETPRRRGVFRRLFRG